MSSSTATSSSLAKSRTLRSNSLKPLGSLNPQPTAPKQGPSSVTLFLANLRLLELDLRDDWPDITPLTFSTKDAQQNQKKRIQSVEWALYHLFALWDREETQNKLQPFFPPLEPLQSLNLRAALFRCLDQAKKIGVLGRDTVLRKTMLDECKGERLEEVLAVFSNAVLKKVLQQRGSDHHEAIARQLAFENFSYTGERTVLFALILSHKASLGKHLREKEGLRARYRDFSDLLNLDERRIIRRHEQLKQMIEEQGSQNKLSETEAAALRSQVRKNWSGSDEWLETILYGDSRSHKGGLLATRFDTAWKHVENSSIGDVEGKQNVGLLKQLDARVKDQMNRLARWQDFGRNLSKTGTVSPSKQKGPELEKKTKIDLGFSRHEELQIGRSSKTVGTTSAVSLHEYTRLIGNMKAELDDVGKPQPCRPRQRLRPEIPLPSLMSPPAPRDNSPSEKDEEWSSASDTDEPSPDFNSYAKKSRSQTPPSEAPASDYLREEAVLRAPSIPQKEARSTLPSVDPLMPEAPKPERKPTTVRKQPSLSPPPPWLSPPPMAPPKAQQSIDPESEELADQILNSMAATSPSPKKARYTLSLAERTRLSMSRASHSQYSDLHDDCDDLTELPRLSILPKLPAHTSPSASSEEDKHASLIERTRKNMAGFEAAQEKAKLERRSSIRDAKRKQRESSYFPKLNEEDVMIPSDETKGLLEGDPDYESVFMSRPKIKTSPAVSPTRTWGDEDELGD